MRFDSTQKSDVSGGCVRESHRFYRKYLTWTKVGLIKHASNRNDSSLVNLKNAILDTDSMFGTKHLARIKNLLFPDPRHSRSCRKSYKIADSLFLSSNIIIKKLLLSFSLCAEFDISFGKIDIDEFESVWESAIVTTSDKVYYSQFLIHVGLREKAVIFLEELLKKEGDCLISMVIWPKPLLKLLDHDLQEELSRSADGYVVLPSTFYGRYLLTRAYASLENKTRYDMNLDKLKRGRKFNETTRSLCKFASCLLVGKSNFYPQLQTTQNK